MNQYLFHINNSIDEALDNNLPIFKTSLNIVREVMNVPLCALESLLRQNGYSDIDPSSICIDEKMLEIFTEAYVRKLKGYFRSSLRNIGNLSREEKQDLNDFINTFRNRTTQLTGKPNWDHIDTELIQRAFLSKIKESTPNQFDRFLEYICLSMTKKSSHRTSEYVNERIWRTEPYSSITPHKLKDKTTSTNQLLSRISESYHYNQKQVVKRIPIPPIIPLLRNILIAARYHIYVADDIDSYNTLPIKIYPISDNQNLLLTVSKGSTKS